MALTLERISVNRGGRSILRDVSATFEPGRVTVILGPNGAGKSTLLQVAAGLLRAEGRVLIDGQDVARLPARERARAIGYLPQDATVHWDMTVEEVVALGRLPYQDRNMTEVEDAMEQTGTTHFAQWRVGTLSGGERSRVLLARVLAGKPRWLLADEPLASLDPAHAFAMFNCLRNIGRAGTGIVLVMHDLAQAAMVADDVQLLAAGRAVKSGSAGSTLTKQCLEPLYGVTVTTFRSDERDVPVPVGLLGTEPLHSPRVTGPQQAARSPLMF